MAGFHIDIVAPEVVARHRVGKWPVSPPIQSIILPSRQMIMGGERQGVNFFSCYLEETMWRSRNVKA